MSNGGAFHCSDDIIKSGRELIGEGNLVCFSGCIGTLGSLAYQCTDYSVIEDWSSGRGRIIATLNSKNATFGLVS